MCNEFMNNRIECLLLEQNRKIIGYDDCRGIECLQVKEALCVPKQPSSHSRVR